MRRRTWIIAGIAAALALAGGWYWGSPWWTLWRMREAARAGDAAALASYVDLGAVTRHTFADRRRGSSLVIGLSDGIHALLRAEGERKTDRHLGYRALIRNWLSDLPVGLAGFGAGADRWGRHPYLRRDGLDRFELRYREASEERGPVLAFRREGIGWKLERVRFGEKPAQPSAPE